MNTNPTVLSALRAVARFGTLGACLALAACGQDQNWDNAPTYVKIGGEVAGLSGTVILRNNGQDDLTVTTNGAFTFGLSIASGDAYAVTVRTQPLGQVCTVTSGTGTATATVTSVRVTCKSDVSIGGTISGLAGGTVILQNNGGNALATAANGAFAFTSLVSNGSTYSVTVRTQPAGQTCAVNNGAGTATASVTNISVICAAFTLRDLPAIYYEKGKAINYSAYRAGGPGAGEIPSDADVLQDLTLLYNAGFRLLRLFGADAVSAKILRIAAANFPEMKFQQGIYLQGAPASCVDAVNQDQIATGIALTNQNANVVTVSVGNETSFAQNLPITCLASYVQTVRSQVTKPVTADDDFSFYAGRSAGGYKPDTVLPLLDFVSIHMYPISNYNAWNWQQTGVLPAGPLRAEAMMNASFANAREAYDAAANYLYRNAAGATVTIGNSLKIVVGETGWKAVQSNPASAIETYAANPVNAKWYYDLMLGWEGSAGGPVTVFYFEAFDEAWKGTDDRWGLWDRARAPRYALCGMYAGAPACNADLYQGAGYYP
ncbi:MAG: hypothetical protein IT483_15220 [Gammaproteobacteria bacterium]|nr:hypothetical protein [Gammaproteobacteria bacterium]